MSTARKPAITRTVGHPADTIPERTAVVVEPDQPKLSAASNPPVKGGERLTEQHNVRIRSSVKERLGRRSTSYAMKPVTGRSALLPSRIKL